jgi:hypothetical protein
MPARTSVTGAVRTSLSNLGGGHTGCVSRHDATALVERYCPAALKVATCMTQVLFAGAVAL